MKYRLKDWSDDRTYKSLDQFFSRKVENKNSGIIFCPHVNWIFGVKDVATRLTRELDFLDTLTNIYAGSSNDKDLINLEVVQNHFKSDKLGLLVATEKHSEWE